MCTRLNFAIPNSDFQQQFVPADFDRSPPYIDGANKATVTIYLQKVCELCHMHCMKFDLQFQNFVAEK